MQLGAPGLLSLPMPPVASPTTTADAAASSAGLDNDFDAGSLASLLAGDAPEDTASLDHDEGDVDAEGYPLAADAADADQDEGATAPAADDDDAATAEAAATTEGNTAPEDAAAQDDAAAALDEEGRKARASFTAAQQRIFDREIAKVKRKDREAREALERSNVEREQQLASLQQELETARNAAPTAPLAPSPDSPLAGIDDESALEARLAQARAIRRWAVRHPQGGIVTDEKGNEVEVSEDRAAAMLAESEDVIEVHAPKRREFLAARAAATRNEAEFYPWLKDPKSPGSVLIAGALKRHPVIAELFPDARLILAHALVGQQVTGQRLQQERAAKGTKPGAASPNTIPSRPVAPKAPASPAGGTRPPRVAAAPKRAAAAAARLEETGDDPDNAALGALLASAA